MEKILSDSYVSHIKNNLTNKLIYARKTKQLSELSAVLMHDFFFDRLVQIKDLDHFLSSFKEIYDYKGGSYPHGIQTNQRGGNAANCASWLGNFGVETYFIGRTDELGKILVDYYLNKKSGVNVSRTRADGYLATTTAIEVGEEKTNIMINDLNSFSPFSFDDLTDEDFKIMEKAEIIGVFDWAANTKGTDLANGVFNFANNHHINTYFDTSDPSSRKDDIFSLFTEALMHPGLSFLSVNENELHQFTNNKVQSKINWSEIREIAIQLKNKIHAELQVHTSQFSAIIKSDEIFTMPTYMVSPLRATGAGDSWNAGNILGILLELDPDERLLLANSVACFYITSSNPDLLSIDNLISFLKNPNNQLNNLE